MECPNCERETEEIQITNDGPKCSFCNSPDYEEPMSEWDLIAEANDRYFNELEVCEICNEYYHPDYGSCCVSEDLD